MKQPPKKATHQTSPDQIAAFRRAIRGSYRRSGRRFPWRETRDPYAILVSEVMLQQTQTERVLPKYAEFLHRFPTFASLARCRTRDLLRVWQGLGYNRRALALQRCAGEVQRRFGGVLPADPSLLVELPGIGPYTAGAVALFAFDRPGIFIETNIRSVFIHFFFPRRTNVRDEEIVKLIVLTLPQRRIREWYYALMDYGVMLKQRHRGIGRRSAHYVRQSPFKGSRRELRGRVIKTVVARGQVSTAEIKNAVRAPETLVREIIKELSIEGFITSSGGRWRCR